MTPDATAYVAKIVTAKGPRTVVTGGPVIRRAAVMLGGGNIRNLPPLRSPRVNLVTLDTAHAGVVGVCKDRLKNITALRRSAMRAKIVTGAARTDIALGRVARVAICMGLESGRDRFTGS